MQQFNGSKGLGRGNGSDAAPRVTGSAPMVHAGQKANLDFRSAQPMHRAMPQGQPGLPRSQPVGLNPDAPRLYRPGGHHLQHHQPAPIGGGAAAASPRSPSPPANSGTPTPPASTADQQADTLSDYYPADLVYEVEKFMKLRHCQRPVPTAVMQQAALLWRDMPENIGSLSENNTLRDNLFKEDNATMPSKVLTDRKLHNEVLGILGKVTESNLHVMQKELTDLPIRQSTEGEIRDVINVFFRKCTRPEDGCYTPLYVKLIAHLVATIGEHEPAGRMIRTEVILQCKHTFINAADESKALESRVQSMGEEEANLERMQFSGKQKANIKFLGLLFVHNLASELVVHSVLDNLMYGDGLRRRIVPEYSVIHFMDLLQTCAPHLSAKFHRETMPHYTEVLNSLRQNHPSRRVQFLVLNFLEALENNWVPTHGPGASPKAPGSGGFHNASPIPSPVAAPDTKLKIPDREEFWRVMDDFFSSSDVDEITTLIKTIPSDVVIAYCSGWLGRYITTYKYAQERSRLGELFEQLAMKNAISAQDAREALRQHARQAIAEDLFEDQPKYFSHWAQVIKHGRSIFPLSLHTELLNMLSEGRVAQEIIVKMVSVVLAEEKERGDKDYRLGDRVRVLQATLRYAPPLLSQDCCFNEEEEEEASIFDKLDFDVEVDFFKRLCEAYEDNTLPVFQCATDALKKGHNAAYPLVSAYFTFIRFDIESMPKSKEILKKFITVRPAASLLEEVYLQWRALECPPVQYFLFVKKFMALLSPAKVDEQRERLRERLRTEYGEDQFVNALDKYMK